MVNLWIAGVGLFFLAFTRALLLSGFSILEGMMIHDMVYFGKWSMEI
jgi:hypothetical protein